MAERLTSADLPLGYLGQQPDGLWLAELTFGELLMAYEAAVQKHAKEGGDFEPAGDARRKLLHGFRWAMRRNADTDKAIMDAIERTVEVCARQWFVEKVPTEAWVVDYAKILAEAVRVRSPLSVRRDDVTNGEAAR